MMNSLLTLLIAHECESAVYTVNNAVLDHENIYVSLNFNNFFIIFFLSLTTKVDGSPEKCSTSRRMRVEETAHSTQVWSKLTLQHLVFKRLRSGEIQKTLEMQHAGPGPCLATGSIDLSEF